MKLTMIGATLCILLLSLLPAHGIPDGSADPKIIVDYLRSLNKTSLVAYCAELEKKHDKRCLRIIAEADVEYSYIAAGNYVALLTPEDAIAYCTRLDLGSAIWSSAVYALQKHPKADVIGYIKQVATSKIREVRYICYQLCRATGWDDLVPFARQDIIDNDTTEPILPNMPFGASVSGQARKYLQSIGKSKAPPPR
jgi:hypothetical protein